MLRNPFGSSKWGASSTSRSANLGDLFLEVPQPLWWKLFSLWRSSVGSVTHFRHLAIGGLRHSVVDSCRGTRQHLRVGEPATAFLAVTLENLENSEIAWTLQQSKLTFFVSLDQLCSGYAATYESASAGCRSATISPAPSWRTHNWLKAYFAAFRLGGRVL